MDSGWLAILKTSGWQQLGISVGLFVFWLLFRLEVLPPTDSPWVVYVLPLAMLIIGGLGVSSLLEKVVKWITQHIQKQREELKLSRGIEQHQQSFADHLPYLTKDEQEIFGWLLKNSQKSFTAEMDCGNGSSLVKRDFIQSDAIGGIGYSRREFPFSIPDHIWTVLEETCDKFPTEFKDLGLPWFRPLF